MKSVDVQALPAPPNLIKALLAGFDSIANHVTLILFPVVLDLFLWFGPHLGMKALLEGLLKQVGTFYGLSAQDLNTVQINLFSLLRTYPIGIPSLMAAWQPFANPLGVPLVLEIKSPFNLTLAWLGLSILGLLFGTLYYSMVARASVDGEVNLWQSLRNWPQASMQVIFLAILGFALLVAVSLPAGCVMSLLAMTGLGANPLAIILFAGVLLWMLFPLVFSPHGIFIGQGKAWASVMDSIRMTRLTIPSTAFFVFTVIIISMGTDYFILRIPNETTWFTLISVIVHGFITSGLLAASFVYYRDANRWIQRLIQQARLSSMQ